MFGRNWVRIRSGIFGNAFTTFVLLWNHPAGFFSANKCIARNFGHGHFLKNEFLSKSRFLGHLFELISHKSGSYGPYGPFRFSEKMRFDMQIFIKISLFGENPIFQIIGKMN